MAKIILVNQMLDTGDEKWNKHSCGICALKMLMVFKKPELQNIPVMTLLNQALNVNGYVEDIGWRHQALVDVAALYGMSLSFQKEFFDTPEKKKEGIKVINEKLMLAPIAASVLKEFNIPNSAHLVVVEGLVKIGPFVRGYRIVDPYPGNRGNRYVVSRAGFLNGWRGGILWLK